jgi:hypothetical protein
VLASSLALATCHSSTAPSGTGTAVLAITVVPNPIKATNSLDPLVYDYDVQYSVTITETAGVGGALQYVSGTLYDPLSGIQVAHTLLDSSDLLVLAGENHLPPKGTLTVQQQLSYRLPSRGRQALLSVDVAMTDDNGHTIEPGVLVNVE